MTEARISGVALRGVRACVPALTRDLAGEGLIPDEAERERLIKSIGVRSRHIAPPGVLTSDLCRKAADGLLDELGWARDTIDVLIMVTQSADYVIPATACALQDRLGLGSCLAFDVNLGCSGYAYGLWTAAALLKRSTIGASPTVRARRPKGSARPASRRTSRFCWPSPIGSTISPGSAESGSPAASRCRFIVRASKRRQPR